jgi:hypothetical protein
LFESGHSFNAAQSSGRIVKTMLFKNALDLGVEDALPLHEGDLQLEASSLDRRGRECAGDAGPASHDFSNK